MKTLEISRSKIGPFSLVCTDPYISIGWEYQSSTQTPQQRWLPVSVTARISHSRRVPRGCNRWGVWLVPYPTIPHPTPPYPTLPYPTLLYIHYHTPPPTILPTLSTSYWKGLHLSSMIILKAAHFSLAFILLLIKLMLMSRKTPIKYCPVQNHCSCKDTEHLFYPSANGGIGVFESIPQ